MRKQLVFEVTWRLGSCSPRGWRRHRGGRYRGSSKGLFDRKVGQRLQGRSRSCFHSFRAGFGRSILKRILQGR
jgi:hypothetical protein